MGDAPEEHGAGHDEETRDEKSILPANAFFFMHIAKTAGSFVNDVLSRGLGKRFLDHCEAAGRLATPDVAFWSGHVFLPQWRDIETANAWKTQRFTVLRNPASQTVSHILWLDHYAQPEFRREYNRLDPQTRQVVDLVGATDLADAGAIDHMLTHLPGRGVQYFDNCQSLYFLAGADGIGIEDYLHLGMRTRLREVMKAFAVIGVGERMEDFIRRMSEAIAFPLVYEDVRVNEAKSKRAIDLTDPEIQAVIAKRVTLDNWLYQAVKTAETVKAGA
jgi:hypothetical protein